MPSMALRRCAGLSDGHTTVKPFQRFGRKSSEWAASPEFVGRAFSSRRHTGGPKESASRAEVCGESCEAAPTAA